MPPPQTPAAAAASASPTLQMRDELIGESSPGSKLEAARSTKNHLAWVEKKGGTRLVKLDGKQVGGSYEDVEIGLARYNPESLYFFSVFHSCS